MAGFPVRQTITAGTATTIYLPDGGSLYFPAGCFATYNQTILVSAPMGFPNCKGAAFAGPAYVVANVTAANVLNPAVAPTYTFTFLNGHQSDVNNLNVYRANEVSDGDPGCWTPVPTRADPQTASLMGGKPAAGATAWGAFAVGRSYTYS